MPWTDEWIEEAVDVVLSARDFCGSEKEAFYEFCDDYDLNRYDRRARRTVFDRANARWDRDRQLAGVPGA